MSAVFDAYSKIKDSLLWKEIDGEMIKPMLEINLAIVESHLKPENYQKFWEQYEQRGYYASRKIAFTAIDRFKTRIPSYVKKRLRAILHNKK